MGLTFQDLGSNSDGDISATNNTITIPRSNARPPPEDVATDHGVAGETVNAPLLHAATTHQDNAAAFEEQHNGIKQSTDKITDLDDPAQLVWHFLHETHDRKDEATTYEMVGPIFREICGAINRIAMEASAAHVSFGTKQSGLQTLHKIGMTICPTPGTDSLLKREVSKPVFENTGMLEDAFKSIIATMSAEEKGRVCQAQVAGTTFLKKMDELYHLGSLEMYCVFDDMGHVLYQLTGDGSYLEKYERWGM